MNVGAGDGSGNACGEIAVRNQANAGSGRAHVINDFSMPRSLEEALEALERDHDFLLKGDVFTEELLRTYVDYKRLKEVEAIRKRPHPFEFALYYDI